MPRTIILVACVRKKRPELSLAKELYCSDWFQKARHYAEDSADQWFILSAKFGLLKPDQVISPYDETLKKMGKRDKAAWANSVLGQLKTVLQPGDRIVVLAGNDYRENLIQPLVDLGFTVDIPMKGLRIGEQLSWLKAHGR